MIYTFEIMFYKCYEVVPDLFIPLIISHLKKLLISCLVIYNVVIW